jgi:hypothetical protein
VKLGKDPLTATLWFGGRYGNSAVKMESGRDGKFHGILPHDGSWIVDVTSTDPNFSTRTKVEVESDGQDRLRAEIDLPATAPLRSPGEGASRHDRAGAGTRRVPGLHRLPGSPHPLGGFGVDSAFRQVRVRNVDGGWDAPARPVRVGGRLAAPLDPIQACGHHPPS